MTYDFLIVGSGFGGSVAAARLVGKGYRVAVLEAGRRWAPAEFPKSNWDLRRYLWAPSLRCFGIQRITFLKGLVVLHGSGVGGGSLVYANTLFQPPDEVFRDPAWPAGVDWVAELKPHFAMARRMLGVTSNRFLGPADQELRLVGERLGVGGTFKATDVGVYFGEPGQPAPGPAQDPYFDGKGPPRSGCTLCGGCMIGCRHGAKNMLTTNYLHFAEAGGAAIHAETEATRVTPVAGGYQVETRRSTGWGRRAGPTFTAARVVLAGGVLGTLELLLRNRDDYRTLPELSRKVGDQVRTNGESLVGATSIGPRTGFSKGLAIGASIQADAVTHIEAVRYPSGSSFMRTLAVPLTPGGSRWARPLKMLGRIAWRLPRLFRLLTVPDYADRSVILLVMQTVDRKVGLRLGRSFISGFRRGLVVAAGAEAQPSHLDVAQVAARHLATSIGGEPQNVLPEVLLGSVVTAHALGGCPLGTVVDHRHEVQGYPGLYVCDGSVVASNLGVNPSLTITALAERFSAQFPKKN